MPKQLWGHPSEKFIHGEGVVDINKLVKYYLKHKQESFIRYNNIVARVSFVSRGLGLGDILIYRDIFNRDYRIEGRNLSDDISKLSSCSMTIVILLRMCI
jgi:hypothetical protein